MSFIKRKKDWELNENLVTKEEYVTQPQRRSIIKGASAALISSALPNLKHAFALDLDVDRPITNEKVATTYNNFYEFASHKNIWEKAQKMTTSPWTINISGLVEKPFQIAYEDLLKKVTIEERIYRLRCVEAWAMIVPWQGFPFSALLDIARPLSSAKYVLMTTATQKSAMPGLKQFWYPWPYNEALTIEEASNELAFLVTGLFGKTLPKQNGAPLRLAVPWKYGFKSIKSIVQFHFTDTRPSTFWNKVAASEYGFWANVNPDVPHKRWSQSSERMVDTKKSFPTQIFNGYAPFVAQLYDSPNLKNEKLFT